MKVYDCFTFYNEFELLELRLRSLWDMVDYFVIVEADKTQSNIPKPFYFAENERYFAEFLPKIKNVLVEIDLPYKGSGDWSIENAQRNAISEGLNDAEDDDLIFISDLDEIPAPDIVQRINNRKAPVVSQYVFSVPISGKKLVTPCVLMLDAIDLLEVSPIALEQSWHYYYFDWTCGSMTNTTQIVKFKNITTPQELRKAVTSLPYIPNGGWHFSYMGGADRIVDKVQAIVEGNDFLRANPNLSNENYIKECMRTGRDIYGREGIPESQFYPYDISNITLPYLDEFLKKYPQFLRATDPGLK